MVDSDSAFFLGSVTKATPERTELPDLENEWIVELPVPDSSVAFKIDTGANISVMSQTAFSRFGEVWCLGKFLAMSQYKGQHK